MKYIYTFVFILLCSISFLNAQIPNGGFENWIAGEPDAWTTNNSDPYFTITQSNSARSGSSALKGEAIAFVPPFLPVLAPVAICAGDNDEGFPIELRFNSLKGFYKSNPQGGDQVIVTVVVSQDTVAIGGGSVLLDAAASYTEFGIPITYIDSGNPNRCWISIQIANLSSGNATIGSEMYIDDLQLSMDIVSDVTEDYHPINFQLDQNYPNPFNPGTKIKFTVGTDQFVSIKVYDILGNEVASLVNEEKPAGVYELEFDGSMLSSGVYFYKLIAGNFTQTKKMQLIK